MSAHVEVPVRTSQHANHAELAEDALEGEREALVSRWSHLRSRCSTATVAVLLGLSLSACVDDLSGSEGPSATSDSDSDSDSGVELAGGGAGAGSSGLVAGDGGDGDGGSNRNISLLAPCTPDEACGDAVHIGSVSGETSSKPLYTTGSKDMWVKFNVREDWNEAVEGEPLRVRVELFGPASVNYDLELFRGVDEGENPCGNNMKSSAEPSSHEVIVDTWGEDAFNNFSDDERTLAVHVYNTALTCDPEIEWTLVIMGNTE